MVLILGGKPFNFVIFFFFIDIPLLPSISSLSLSEHEDKNGPFVVHWLNNKELHFTLSMEVFLQQLRKSFEQPSSEASAEDCNQADVKSDEGNDLTRISHFIQNCERFCVRVNLSLSVTSKYSGRIQIWISSLKISVKVASYRWLFSTC